MEDWDLGCFRLGQTVYFSENNRENTICLRFVQRFLFWSGYSKKILCACHLPDRIRLRASVFRDEGSLPIDLAAIVEDRSGSPLFSRWYTADSDWVRLFGSRTIGDDSYLLHGWMAEQTRGLYDEGVFKVFVTIQTEGEVG